MRTLLAAVVLSVATAAAVPAQTRAVVPEGDERVSIHAEGVRLGQLLRELATLTPMTLRIDPVIDGVPVTLRLDDVYIEQAIDAVLEASHVDSVAVGLQRLDARTPIRVIAGRAKAAVDIAAGVEDKAPDPPPVAAPPLDEVVDVDAAKDREQAEARFAQSGGGVDTPGNMTSADWMAALFPPSLAAPRPETVMLPFVDETGQPIQQPVSPVKPPTAMLPFADPSGQPLVVPIQDRPDGLVLLPFVENGRPLLVPGPTWQAGVPAASPVPGRRGGRR